MSESNELFRIARVVLGAQGRVQAVSRLAIGYADPWTVDMPTRSAFTVSLLAAAAAEDSSLAHSYYVLRHGQSLANVAGIISSDPRTACAAHGLSTQGRRQAEQAAAAVAAAAANEGVDGVAIVTSDLRRAWMTASLVRTHLMAAGVRVWPAVGGLHEATELRERSFGELDGQSDSRYPDVWVEDANSASHEVYGVESVLSVRERALSVIKRTESLLPRDGGRYMVVLVAHGDVLQILQSAFFEGGIDPREHRSLPHLETATLRLMASAGTGMPDTCKSSAWPDKFSLSL